MNFEKLGKFLDELTICGGIPGVDIAVCKNHELVYRHMAGLMDRDNKTPISADTLYYLYSASKPITCAAALQLFEQGEFLLNEPVGKYLPEFYDCMVKEKDGSLRKPASPILIRDLFCMTSGFSYDIEEARKAMRADGKADCTTREMMKYFAKIPLLFDPGTHWNYGISHDIIAALIEVVSGMSFGEYLKKNIFDVLGMSRTATKTSMVDTSKLSQQYVINDKENCTDNYPFINYYYFTESYESGGAGTISCVDDYILFADAMACGGIGRNGKRILSPQTVELMKSDFLDDVKRADMASKTTMVGYSYGLGVRTLVNKKLEGNLAPIGEFGWDGAAGAYTLFDTENGISVYYAQQVMNGKGYINHPRIRNLVYEGFSQE